MSAVTDSGDTAPTPRPAAGQPPIPPRPPAPGYGPPAMPPYAAASAQPSAPQGGDPSPQDYPTVPQYPTPPQYATLPYPPQQYAPFSAPPQGQAATPHTYAPPPGYAPPPQGYGPYVPSARPAPATRGAALGVVAFVLSVLAAVGATVLGSIAAFNIGLGTGREIAVAPMDIDFDWSILTPVREWVLLGELAFWAGTIVGIWALVQGIVAIVKNRGRGWGIAAVVIAGIGPIVFATGVQAFLAAGFASGASVGG